MEHGLELMAAGMGVVFLFLVLLVLIMIAVSNILQKFEKPEQLAAAPAGSSGDQLTQVAIAIAVAKRKIHG